MFKKICLWLLIFCIMTGQTALGESVPEEEDLNPAPRVEAFMPHWIGLNDAVEEGRKASVSMTGELTQWNPFEAETTALINQLLRHCSMDVEYIRFRNEPGYAVDIRVDGKTAVNFVQKKTDQGTEWLTDLTDTRYIQRSGEPLMPFMAADPQEEDFSWEEVLLSDAAPENVLYSLMQQIKPMGSPKKASRKLSKIGTAKKLIKVTLTAEETWPALEKALAQLNSPLAETILNNITLTGDQYVFSIYQDKDGKDLSLILTGRASYGGSDARKVTLNWRFKEEETRRLDLISFEAPAVKGSNDLTVKIEWERTWEGDDRTSHLTGSATSVVDKDKDVYKVEADLTNAMLQDTHHLTGSVTLEEKPADVTYQTVYTPDIVTGYDGEYMVEGSLGIVETRSKNVLLDSMLNLKIETAEGLIQEPAGLARLLVLDEMDENERNAAVEELTTAIAGRLLTAMMALPTDERTVLMQGISEENQALVEEAFQAIQP